MAKAQTPTNPFYVLLIIAGVLFSITACAYGVMTLRGVMPREMQSQSESGQGLMQFLDLHGMWLMGGELVLLALSTFGAMATDSFWYRRANRTPPSNPDAQNGAGP